MDKPWWSMRMRLTEIKMDCGVEEDARKLGCRNSLVDAQDRGHWRYLLGEAKAYPGL